MNKKKYRMKFRNTERRKERNTERKKERMKERKETGRKNRKKEKKKERKKDSNSSLESLCNISPFADRRHKKALKGVDMQTKKTLIT